MSKRDFGDIKSLVHFNFPYYNEPHDGLDDEVRGAVWEREGNTKLVGVEIPYEYKDSPKFGYRCAYYPDTTSHVTTSNSDSVFNLDPTRNYEFEAFVKTKYVSDEYCYIFNGHTFRVIDQKVTQYPYNNSLSWADAKTACEAVGGHLATCTSEEKKNFLQSLIRDGWTSWLDGTCDPETGIWSWGTGEEWEYTNWRSGAIWSSDAYYLAMNNDGIWDKYNSSFTKFYICEWDYDLFNSTNPIGDRFDYRIFNGHKFCLISINSKTWVDAKADCEARGGHLATSTSAEKNTFLASLCSAVNNVALLGGFKETANSPWQWVTGETWDYTNWQNGYPSTNENYNSLLLTNNTGHTWQDTCNLWSYYYICEWDYDKPKMSIQAGNIFNLGEELILSVNKDGTLTLQSTAWGINATSTLAINVVTNTWYHIALRIINNTAKVYLDGTEAISANIISNTILAPETVTLGGYYGYMDEFVFRHNTSNNILQIPTHPYIGRMDSPKVGGYGTGADGNVVISTNTQINSYALINAINDEHTFTVSSWSNGAIVPAVGTEVMIHITAPISEANADYPLVGLYAFSKIASIDGNTVSLTDNIRETGGYDFTLDSTLLNTYYVQVITIPNYASLTINAEVTINPLAWRTNTSGGIVAFRCMGNCTINGSIITRGYGASRFDYYQMTNSKLIDRFLCASGGGIFITCGSTFTTPSTARLGASYSGLGDGSNGAAGHGGNGGNVLHANKNTANGGIGGVGGGGGGATCYTYLSLGGNCGSQGNWGSFGSGGGGCGGQGGYGSDANYGCGGGGGGGQANSGGSGGGGTKRSGHSASGVNGADWRTVSSKYGVFPSGAGGGAPGGNGGTGCRYVNNNNTFNYLGGGSSGACIVLICERLNVDIAALSTGGAVGGSNSTSSGRVGAGGGGGTGFCYIACREQVN